MISSQIETSVGFNSERKPASGGLACIRARKRAVFSDGGDTLKCMDLHLFRIQPYVTFGMIEVTYGKTKIFSLCSQEHRR